MSKRKVKNHRPPKNDLTGQVFGHLEVIKMAQTEKSGKRCDWRAICKCHNCGNDYYDADQQALKRGYTKSCGCDKSKYKKITGDKNKNFKGYEEIRGKTWADIKKKASKRNISFEIDIKYAWELFLKQDRKCALSNIPIKFGRVQYRLETTASLDRIDSNKPYVKGNIQWVHKSVNLMKNDLSEEIFIGICSEISNKFRDNDKPDIEILSENHFLERSNKRSKNA